MHDALDSVYSKGLVAVLAAGLFASCSSLPEPKFTRYEFPAKSVFIDDVTPPRKYETLGLVRTRVNYNTLNPDREEADLCRNAYNKAARDLLRIARRDAKGDAVIEVRSVVFFLDGTTKLYKTPECSDDGGEGQILLQGIAIRWPVVTPSPSPKPEETKRE